MPSLSNTFESIIVTPEGGQYKKFIKFRIEDASMEPIILAVCLAGLVIGSYTDLRTREVPDWINYGLMAAGFGIAIIYSVTYWRITFLFDTLIGFGAGFAIAMLMYYTGQWGGGDSKMLMGLGALIGLPLSLSKIPFLALFVLYSTILGALYGLVWSAVLAIRNRTRFMKEYHIIAAARSVRIGKIALIILAIVSIIISFLIPANIRILTLSLTVVMIGTFYLFIFVKVVEKAVMLKDLPIEKLTPGDWIAEDVVVAGKHICGPKDLGIDKKQIEKLMKLKSKGKVTTVLVKEGIPFVPSFLMAFVAVLALGASPLSVFLG
jgi:Flp pilus assembly protein protease CpaA